MFKKSFSLFVSENAEQNSKGVCENGAAWMIQVLMAENLIVNRGAFLPSVHLFMLEQRSLYLNEAVRS